MPKEASHFIAAVDEARKAARGVAPPGSRPHFLPAFRPAGFPRLIFGLGTGSLLGR